MAETPSTMLDIGTPAPDFVLPNTTDNNNSVRNTDYTGQPLLVIFTCNHCPYVIHILQSLTEFANQAVSRNVGVVMISSNDVDRYTADSPVKMAELAMKYHFDFPYLYDENQSVALAYKAACTPDLFLFNSEHKLVYRGQYDSSRPGNRIAVTGEDLKNALESLQSGKAIKDQQIPSVGCGIKWKPGNEPDYF